MTLRPARTGRRSRTPRRCAACEAAAGSQLDPQVVEAVLASVGVAAGRTAGHVEAA